MIRFERALEVACVCCKADGADIPEVEAVIRLLLPQVRAALQETTATIVARANLLLNQDGIEPSDLALLLAAYVTMGHQVGLRPLTERVTRNAELSARALFQAAADAGALPGLSEAAVRARATQAAEALQLLAQQVIADSVDRSVETARRLAVAPSAAVPAVESADAWRRELEQALDAERAVQPLVDGWAYQTYNIASVRAAAADGHNFVMLQAKLDNATTAFCRLVDGRVVPMARALAQLDRIEQAVAAGDVDALVSAAPFVSNPKTATPADVDAILARGGLAPFHHGCRTRNVPIRLNAPAAEAP
jgi:hypothetical protein